MLFAASFFLHWKYSAAEAAAEARMHGAIPLTMAQYLWDPRLWFESFQNWQSEFRSTAVLVVLSIFLRQKDSPESQPVAAPPGQPAAWTRPSLRKDSAVKRQDNNVHRQSTSGNTNQ